VTFSTRAEDLLEYARANKGRFSNRGARQWLGVSEQGYNAIVLELRKAGLIEADHKPGATGWILKEVS
jgi:hypothetical protein